MSDELTFTVYRASGAETEVTVLRSDVVGRIRQLYEAQHPPPGLPDFVKLCQGPDALLDDTPVARLEPDVPLIAVVVRDTRPEILMQAAGIYHGYDEMLDAAGSGALEDATAVTVGPFPSILHVLESLAGELVEVPDLTFGATTDTLEYRGNQGQLLLPSLSLAPFLRRCPGRKVVSVTVEVGVNSDAYNNGLGIMLAASPHLHISGSEAHLQWYAYNSYGVSQDRRSNAVKFHPGMSGGQLRIEGRGGWGNQDIGFTPLGYTASGNKLHSFGLTTQVDGCNRFDIRGTRDGESWSSPWNHQLFDGSRTPSVHAWLDMVTGSVVAGQVSLVLHLMPESEPVR